MNLQNYNLVFGSRTSFMKKFKKCAYSGERFSKSDIATIEHIVPRANGGRNEYSNFLVVKKSWNSDRADLPLDVFIMQNPKVRENIIATVNSKEGQIIEGINWADEVKKTLLTAIGYDIFK